MNKVTVPSFLRETANDFGAIKGVEAVAWCGSSATGSADTHSDFDFYVYTHTPVSVEARELKRLDAWIDDLVPSTKSKNK